MNGYLIVHEALTSAQEEANKRYPHISVDYLPMFIGKSLYNKIYKEMKFRSDEEKARIIELEIKNGVDRNSSYIVNEPFSIKSAWIDLETSILKIYGAGFATEDHEGAVVCELHLKVDKYHINEATMNG